MAARLRPAADVVAPRGCSKVAVESLLVFGHACFATTKHPNQGGTPWTNTSESTFTQQVAPSPWWMRVASKRVRTSWPRGTRTGRRGQPRRGFAPDRRDHRWRIPRRHAGHADHPARAPGPRGQPAHRRLLVAPIVAVAGSGTAGHRVDAPATRRTWIAPIPMVVGSGHRQRGPWAQRSETSTVAWPLAPLLALMNQARTVWLL